MYFLAPCKVRNLSFLALTYLKLLLFVTHVSWNRKSWGWRLWYVWNMNYWIKSCSVLCNGVYVYSFYGQPVSEYPQRLCIEVTSVEFARVYDRSCQQIFSRRLAVFKWLPKCFLYYSLLQDFYYIALFHKPWTVKYNAGTLSALTRRIGRPLSAKPRGFAAKRRRSYWIFKRSWKQQRQLL